MRPRSSRWRAIELARKAIVAVIKAIGEALIAITDVLLAAFPELKARFQAAIRAAVTKAVDTVNKLAEGLKKAVQAALDLLGKAIDAALSLLEKGLHAIVDLAADMVQGAIDAAKAIVDALGPVGADHQGRGARPASGSRGWRRSGRARARWVSPASRGASPSRRPTTPTGPALARRRASRKKKHVGADGPEGKPKKKHDKDSDRDRDKKKSGKDKKKANQDKKDEALVGRVARQAASAGWRHAKTTSGSRVQSHAEVESAVHRAARGPAGVRADVDIVEAGSSWRVKAKASKGSHTATSSTGNGTTLRAKSGSTWYTSKNLRSLHQQILRDTARELKQPGSSKGKDVQAVYRAKQALAQQLEAKGQAKINSRIQGIKFDISMESFAGVKDDHKIKTGLLISPNYEELELNIPATGDDTFKELVERLQKEVMSKNPYHNEDVILAGCDKVASALGIQWTTAPQSGAKGKIPVTTMVVKFTAPDASGEKKTYVAQIVRQFENENCPSCGSKTTGNKGTIVSHNVISQDIWERGSEAAIQSLGLPSPSPLSEAISAEARGGLSGAMGEGQKQCPHCEAPGTAAKTGTAQPLQGQNLPLIQRGKLPNPHNDPSIVGNQFGGTSSTNADHEAATAAHVKKVVTRLGGVVRHFSKKYASDPAADITGPQHGAFMTVLETTIRALAR